VGWEVVEVVIVVIGRAIEYSENYPEIDVIL
jgi:hypothetical protein